MTAVGEARSTASFRVEKLQVVSTVLLVGVVGVLIIAMVGLSSGDGGGPTSDGGLLPCYGVDP